MRRQAMVLALCFALSMPWLSGCAKLNQWLEGTVGEEEKTDQEDPWKTLSDQQKALAGTDQAKRKEAVGKMLGLVTVKPPTDAKLAKATEDVRPQALAASIKLLDDPDPGVASAALAGFATAVSFPEKTEDERQLDPEAYQRSLNIKRTVFNDGMERVLNVVSRPSTGLNEKGLESLADLRYFAISILTNLAKAPVVAGEGTLKEAEQDKEGRAELKQKVAQPVVRVAQDKTMATDVRLLAIECVVALADWDQVGTLSSLLSDADPLLRARTALAFAQAAPGLGQNRGAVDETLYALASSTEEPEQVRWCSTLALGALGSPLGAKLTNPVLPPPPPPDSLREPDPSDGPGMAPLEAYRTYALAASGDTTAVSQLNAEVNRVAKEAEEQLAADRKKGYK